MDGLIPVSRLRHEAIEYVQNFQIAGLGFLIALFSVVSLGLQVARNSGQ
jgi:hypothetical protein